jgi:hypothetical protein
MTLQFPIFICRFGRVPFSISDRAEAVRQWRFYRCGPVVSEAVRSSEVTLEADRRKSSAILRLGDPLNGLSACRRAWAAIPRSGCPRGRTPDRHGCVRAAWLVRTWQRPNHLHHHASCRRRVVSMASVRLRKPALASPKRSMMVSTSRSERESRSSFQTTRTSPLRS